MQMRTCAALAALIMVGCVEDESPRAASGAASEQHAPTAPSDDLPPPPPPGPNPCEVLTETKLRAVVSIPEGAQLDQHRGTGYAAKICTYRWHDPSVDPEAQRRAMMAKIQQASQEGSSPERIAQLAAAMRGGPEVVYTHVPPEADADAARTSFEAAMQRLNEGVTHQLTRGAAAGQTITLQATTETVEGVCQAAQWSPTLGQLFVLTGNRFFHLGVKVAPTAAENLELAKALATQLCD